MPANLAGTPRGGNEDHRPTPSETAAKPNLGPAFGMSVVMLMVVLSMVFGRAMAGDELMDYIGLPAALLAAVLAWWTLTTPRARVRCDVAFWSGLLFLCNAAELAWRVEERISSHPKGPMQNGWEVWLPMLCAYSLFAGLLLIIWSHHQWQPKAEKAQGPRGSSRAGQ